MIFAFLSYDGSLGRTSFCPSSERSLARGKGKCSVLVQGDIHLLTLNLLNPDRKIN